MSRTTAFGLDKQDETWVHAARAAVFLGVWCLVWITLNPFGDLGSDNLLAVTSGNDFWIYVSFGFLAMACATATLAKAKYVRAALGDRALIALVIYCAYTVVASEDPGSSLRRYILFIAVALIASLVSLLPRDRDEFARLLIGCCLLVLILSYAGVLLIPEYAVHQATDLVEARLAGDWRGIFGHKNLAGGVFSTMVFMGLFAARAGLPLAGIAVTGLAGLFVLLSAAKSSIIILALTLLVTAVCAGIRSTTWRAVVVAAPLVFLLTIGVGSVLSPTIGRLVSALPFDTTFTGRTDIWAFALEHFAQKPLTGHGFMAFWSLENAKLDNEDTEQWAGSASNAHNGFVDTALNIGLIGLVLTVIVLVVEPYVNYAKARRAGADPALTGLFFQLWLFCLYLSCMESFLFSRTDPVWFTLLVAISGLRLAARFRVVAPATEPGSSRGA